MKEHSVRITKYENVELALNGLTFCWNVHRERFVSHFIDKCQSFISMFLYKLNKVQNLPFL